MYNNVDILKAPKGVKMNDYIKTIYLNDEPEIAKDKIFRLTYLLAKKEFRKYSNLISADYYMADMSIAFMKTYNKFDPSKEEGSFMSYYALAIRTEVLLSAFGRYKNTPKDRQFWLDAQNNTSSLNKMTEDKEGKRSELGNTLEDDYNLEADVESRELKTIMFDIIDRTINISNIGKKHSDIFKTFVESKIDGTDLTTDEIGEMYGVTGNNVRKIIAHKKHLIQEKWIKETQI
jgi:hypothetical protein